MAQDAYPLADRRVWDRRSRRTRTLLLSIGATVFVLAFALSASVGLVAGSSLAGIRSTLISSPPDEVSVVLTAPLAKKPAAQDVGVRQVIARSFRGAPVVVTRVVDTADRGSPKARWTITPNPALIGTGDLGRLHTGFGAVESAVTSRGRHALT